MMAELLARFPEQRLGWTLLHFLWQGTAIGLLYALLRSLFSRWLSAHGRYVLASAALVTLTAAPFITFAVNPVSDAPSGFAIRVPQPERVLLIVVALWLAGVLCFSIRLIGGWRFTARLRSAANPAMAAWQQSLASLASALGIRRSVLLLVSPLVEVPVVMGWLRPAILVPIEFLMGFPAEQVRALLAHELAHVLRNDYLANILQGVAETILFYHPAVWWISKQIRLERENCCDDLAVAATGDVEAYARALADLETRLLHPFSAAMAANGGSLLERIRRLIEPAYDSRENLPGPAAAWSMTVLWLAGIGVAAVHAAPTPHSIARPDPHPAPVSVQGPHRPAPKRAVATIKLADIKKTTRKALLYDPLLTLSPAPEIASTLAPDDAKLPVVPYSEPVYSEHVNEIAAASTRADPKATASYPDDSQPAPVFLTAARLVLVDVVVRGSRASALTQQDFTLFDNGKPQKIASFSAPSARAPEPAPVRLGGEGAVSNRLEEDGAAPPNATILLIDQRNTSQPDQIFAIRRVIRFLEKWRDKDTRPGRVGIYTFQSGALRVVQELSGDSERLIRAATSIRVQRPAYSDGHITGTGQRVLETSDVLEAVARHLATVPGRKNLVWIGDEFPLVSSRDSELLPDFNPGLEETARVLTDANLAFYAVDAGGLRGSLSGMTAVSNAETAQFPVPFQLQNSLRPGNWSPGGIDAFTKLAGLSGGITFSNNNGIEDSIESALDDAALSYTLAFYPTEAEQNPAWHKLKVKVSGRGVRVRYREKYFASAAPVSAENHRVLPSLLRDPLNATQLQIAAQAAPDQLRPGFSQVRLLIDIHGLHLENQHNYWVGGVDVSFLLDGSHSVWTVAGKIKLPDDQLEAALEKGLSLTRTISAGSGDTQLHVVAQDRATGAAGSLTVPLSR
jgi:VWFA-related protein